MTEREIAAIRARAAAASPGPWRWRANPTSWRTGPEDEPPGGYDDELVDANGQRVHTDGSARGEYTPDIDTSGPDAAFIAAARSDIPALCGALEVAEKKIAELKAALDDTTAKLEDYRRYD